MPPSHELRLKLHASGLFWTALFAVSTIACATWMMLGFLNFATDPATGGDVDGLLVFFGLVYAGLLLICSDTLIDVIRTALTALQPQWQVRISTEGIHHPLLFGETLPWDEVAGITVSNGLNGKDVYFTLSASAWRLNLLNGFASLVTRRRTGYFIVRAHRFSYNSHELLSGLRELVPERLGFGYMMN